MSNAQLSLPSEAATLADIDATECRLCRLSLNLSTVEFARALRLPGGAKAVEEWEAGTTAISGPESLAIEYLLFMSVMGEEPLSMKPR